MLRTPVPRIAKCLAAIGMVAWGALSGGCSGPERPSVPRLAAQTEGFSPFIFIQAGDPQIGGWTTIKDTQGRFIQLAHQANEVHPPFVIVVGDLVNDGPHAEQLKAADTALAEFQVPVKLIPGNHDDPETYRRRYGPDYYSFTVNNCLFACLNSNWLEPLAPRPAIRRRAEEQWRWLEETLQQARREKRTHIFLVMHHPPQLLPGALRRLKRLVRDYDVPVVLCGHIHRTTQLSLGGCMVYTVAGTGWAGDKRGFGYRVFRVYADRIEQQYVTLDSPVPHTQPADAR
jgi:Icc-related predicted phosphoesterase